MYIYQSIYLFRGDLYQSWEKGMEVFEELLLDADWALNAGNWMWLSASAFFHQYYRYLYVCLSGLSTHDPTQNPSLSFMWVLYKKLPPPPKKEMLGLNY